LIGCLLLTAPLWAHGNPRAETAQTIGHSGNEARINYSRPRVKGRVIWGELVPYDALWRTGADRSTTLTLSGPLKVDGKEVPAGTYGLYTLPGKAGWTFVISNQSQLFDVKGYEQSQDELRVTARVEEAEHQEYMSFSFENVSDTSADIVLRWGELAVSFTITE
jgi:hypothetical protein